MDTYNNDSFSGPTRSLDDDPTIKQEYQSILQNIDSFDTERELLNVSITTFFDQAQNNLHLATEGTQAFNLYDKAESINHMIESHNLLCNELSKLHDRLSHEFNVTAKQKPKKLYHDDAFSIYNSYEIGECHKITSFKDFNVYETHNKDYYVGKKIRDRIYELTYNCFSLSEAKEICVQMHNLRTHKLDQTLNEATVANKLRSRTLELERNTFAG